MKTPRTVTLTEAAAMGRPIVLLTPHGSSQSFVFEGIGAVVDEIPLDDATAAGLAADGYEVEPLITPPAPPKTEAEILESKISEVGAAIRIGGFEGEELDVLKADLANAQAALAAIRAQPAVEPAPAIDPIQAAVQAAAATHNPAEPVKEPV